ncbi:VWA domain-containing protein [uncultured Paracoccus sp.]|uniref:vWA domain-containing protein n=1 Tax=uncultured Paracoccus sp. TaxID=189685 RepID=UPI00260B4859|nr:VWA domain-containing protein [uncultured Paracoccus sp.]
MVALDASGSMAGQAGGEIKMQAATEAVTRFVTSLPEDAEIGLVVFGHEGSNDESGKAESCAEVETLVPVAPDAAGALAEALDALQPTGWTPLATAIEAAGAALAPEAEKGEQVVFIVSDGEETCDGDPVAAARNLHTSGARAIVNVIGFDLPPQDRAMLAEVAEVGGGVYLDAASGDEVMDALQRHSAWIKTRFEHNVEAVRAQTANSTSSFVAKSDASKCVADIQNAEYSLVSKWIADLRERSFSSEAFMGFREMVISDHRKSREMLDAYRTKVEAMSDEADRAIKKTIVAPGAPAPEADN